jgi:hypothetical protein
MSIDGVLCDVVVERVALGEPLGDVSDHAASCPKCRSLVALPTEIGATHREADPGMGFAARMTAGAQHRVVVRRRRRMAAGVAAAVVAMSFGVFFVTREPAQDKISAIKPLTVPPVAGEHHQPDPWNPGEVDDDVAALVDLADTSPRPHAHWKRMENQLAAYRKLVEGAE